MSADPGHDGRVSRDARSSPATAVMLHAQLNRGVLGVRFGTRRKCLALAGFRAARDLHALPMPLTFQVWGYLEILDTPTTSAHANRACIEDFVKLQPILTCVTCVIRRLQPHLAAYGARKALFVLSLCFEVTLRPRLDGRSSSVSHRRCAECRGHPITAPKGMLMQHDSCHH